MAKPIDWPTVNRAAYRGQVSDFRTYLEKVARNIGSAPDLALEIGDHVVSFQSDVVNEMNGDNVAAYLNSLIDYLSDQGGGLLVIPNNGTNIVITEPIVLKSNVHILGMGRPTIYLADGSNCTMLKGYEFDTLTGTTTAGGISNWSIGGLIMNGNMANNSSPDAGEGMGIATYGRDFIIYDMHIIGTYRTGLWTEYTTGSNGVSPFNGRCADVTIDTIGEHGWYNAVSDLHAKSINIKSVSQNSDNTWDCMHFVKGVRGSVFNTWRSGSVTNTHRYSLYSTGGCIMQTYSFETAKTAQMYLSGVRNVITDGLSYNLLGGDHIIDAGQFNTVTGIFTKGGLGVDTAFGVRLEGPNVWGARHDLVMSDLHGGCVNVVSSAGGNVVNVRARAIGNPLVSGTPNHNDRIDINNDASADADNSSYWKFAGRPGSLLPAGSVQGDAEPITTSVARLYTTGTGRGVILPEAHTGRFVWLTSVATQNVNIYPASGESIVGNATDAPIVIAPDASVMLMAVDNGSWAAIT